MPDIDLYIIGATTRATADMAAEPKIGADRPRTGFLDQVRRLWK